MIDRVFWDIDETLIHTETRCFGEGFGDVPFVIGGSTYYTKIRPCSMQLVEFSRQLVGHANVYILTTATREYAREVNRLAGWNFPHSHIFAREDLHEHRYSMAYGGYTTVANREVSSRNNVLIDNLPARENWNKMSFIGIAQDRYLKIDDYYGVDFPNCTFIEDVEQFLLNLHNNDICHKLI